MLYPKARLIRYLGYIRGDSLSGTEDLTIGHFCRFDLNMQQKTVRIGKKLRVW